jgi:hypothetical protein
LTQPRLILMLQDVLWKYSWFQFLRSVAKTKRSPRQIHQWEVGGKQGPPPHAIKQQVLRMFGDAHGLKILVESGTYRGDMIDALKDSFETIYSIELSEPLYKKACWRFRGLPHITLINGDSGREILNVVRQLKGPALFWLDGHYSAGPTAHGELSTPIFDELRHVLTARDKRHVILIDDARCFGIERDYPTLEELTQFVTQLRPDLQVSVEYDSIRVFPRD